MKIVCLIPARYDSTRYEGKLLKPLAGKPVISRTYNNIKQMGIFDEVAVVTNSEDIKNELESHGARVIYIPKEYNSGTDRIADAISAIEADIIINVQGDEPFVRKEPLIDLINCLKEEKNDLVVASLMRAMDDENHINSSDYVKVVNDNKDFALYFSRSVIPMRKNLTPAPTYYEHIGVYAFTRKALITFSQLSATTLEKIESVECLRFLEHGIPIKMVRTDFLILEIDTEADRDRAERLIASGELSVY